MNSLILSSVAAFFKTFAKCFKDSGLYRLLMRIYNAVSASWSKSAIMNVLRKENDNADRQSMTAKILYLPFRMADAFREIAGTFISEKIANSFICVLARQYVQNFMAVNTKFWGIMLLFMSLAYEMIYILTGSFSKIALIISVAGLILSLFNYNLMSFLNPSKFVGLVKNALGFKNLDFEFFDMEATKGYSRIVISAFIGLAAGVAAHYNILYAVLVPFAIFAVLLVLYAPITGVFFAVFAAPFVPTMALAGLCLWTGTALIIKSVSNKNFKWNFSGLGICIILFLAVLLVSSLTSFARIGSLKVWAMYFVFIGFYFIIVNAVETKEQLYGLLKILVISGALVALYGVMQYAFGWTTSNAWIDEEMFEDATMRVYSTLGNPNVLGEYLLLILPLSAVYMLRYKWKELSKWAYGAMFLVLALCLVLTQSRGCWIGFMISAVIFVTFYEGKWWGLLPIVLCILPFVIPQTIVDRIMSVGNMEDTSTSYRVYIWMGTLGMMKHYWLGGIGMGEAAFSQVYPFFSYNAIIAPHSHNLFLQLLVEAGISGLGMFIIMQTVFIKNMSVVYRRGNKKSTDSMLALALGSGVIGFLAQSMFDYTFYNYRVMAVFFMVIAVGMALKNISDKAGGHEIEN